MCVWGGGGACASARVCVFLLVFCFVIRLSVCVVLKVGTFTSPVLVSEVGLYIGILLIVCACVRARARVCVCLCVRARALAQVCVCEYVRVRAGVWMWVWVLFW